MSFSKKHNSGGKIFDFEIPEGFKYSNLKQLVDTYGIEQVHMVNALHVNTKGLFGDAPVIATDNELVNAPQHLIDVVKQARKDAESISMINNGVVGFKIYPYENKYGLCYGLEWVDIEPTKKK